MAKTLQLARQGFVAAIKRDTSSTELPRLVAVLDALIAWSAARPAVLAFRPDDGAHDTVAFELVGSKVVLWSVRLTRGDGPKLEIYPPTGRALTAEERTKVMNTLNEHSREVLIEGDRLRISFGALKNVAARTAVLALMDELLAPKAASA
jgi:hypothetical protein